MLNAEEIDTAGPPSIERRNPLGIEWFGQTVANITAAMPARRGSSSEPRNP